jgi:hypothetical protein
MTLASPFMVFSFEATSTQRTGYRTGAGNLGGNARQLFGDDVADIDHAPAALRARAAAFENLARRHDRNLVIVKNRAHGSTDFRAGDDIAMADDHTQYFRVF